MPIDTYTKRKNEEFAADPTLIAAYRQRFHDTMSFVQKHFPFGFRRNAKGGSTPRARFEAFAVGSFQAMQERPGLMETDVDTR